MFVERVVREHHVYVAKGFIYRDSKGSVESFVSAAEISDSLLGIDPLRSAFEAIALGDSSIPERFGRISTRTGRSEPSGSLDQSERQGRQR